LKILAILGSPHGTDGATFELLAKVLEGCEKEGAETETIVISKKKVLYCTGCGNCLLEGECRTKDDVPEIHRKMEEADGIILASPVYLGTVTGQMKTFLDRCLPIGHRPHLHEKYALSVVASGGIFDEQTAEYLLSALVAFGLYPVGKICGVAVAPGMFEEEEIVFGHSIHLGRELVTAIREKRKYPITGEGFRSKAFFRDLIIKYRGFFQEDYNYWEKKGWLNLQSVDSEVPPISELKTPTTVEDTTLLAAVREMFVEMPSGFNPDAVKKLKAIFQFDISSRGESIHWHFIIENQECKGIEGIHDEPTVRISSSASDWIDLAEGKIGGAKAFMTGKLKAEGKMRLLMKFDKIFQRK